MNKELINKYKAEFDHWLNDGSVLIKSDLGWCPIAKEFHWSHNQPISSLLVINDEYVELRKALAEGKTIQYYDCVAYHSFDPKRDVYDWKDFKSFTQSSPFSKSVGCYRIKPIEFKLGDYVKLTSTTHVASRTYPSWFQIDGKDITLHDSYIYIEKGKHCFYFNELELWQPKPNEWCWFWDKPNSKYGTLTKFHSLRRNKFKSDNCAWTYCAPFIGKLPPHLKD